MAAKIGSFTPIFPCGHWAAYRGQNRLCFARRSRLLSLHFVSLAARARLPPPFGRAALCFSPFGETVRLRLTVRGQPATPLTGGGRRGLPRYRVSPVCSSDSQTCPLASGVVGLGAVASLPSLVRRAARFARSRPAAFLPDPPSACRPRRVAVGGQRREYKATASLFFPPHGNTVVTRSARLPICHWLACL